MNKEDMAPADSPSLKFSKQAQKLSLSKQDTESEELSDTAAVEARFITPVDPVIETVNGSRLPTVPLKEALELNRLREESGSSSNQERRNNDRARRADSLDKSNSEDSISLQSTKAGAPLRTAVPPSQTHPLFPELPLYGPPSLLRNLQCLCFRVASFFLSLSFLAVILLGSAFTSIPLMIRHIALRLMLRDPNARRPFYEQEKRKAQSRKEEARLWKKRRRTRHVFKMGNGNAEEDGYVEEEFEPTEGGKDPLVCDAGYYARRVGLDMEDYDVLTEDGFIIQLSHIYNPKEYTPSSRSSREYQHPVVFPKTSSRTPIPQAPPSGKRRYPVLMIHGLLQSGGAYCTNDDSSLAFFLAKSGFDVWIGNNRCGFHPRHHLLKTRDPRMWAWNIRQMGVMDLPALVSRVLSETRFEKLGLICHSQGTTEAFVALAKEQRPDLGNKLSVFCALAPAVYAGPLIGKMYLKFMRIISPGMFRIMFGIHAFIPFMMTMHAWLPGWLYGALGYRVFSFLFNWSDDRWDQGIRDRQFQFSPVYVSAESMRWWLGRECFATQKCILATREDGQQEDREDKEDEDYYVNGGEQSTEHMLTQTQTSDSRAPDRSRNAWYDDQVPLFALWVAGADELVDGRRLLRRFERGREPYVKIVHAKVIPEYEHLDVLWAVDVIEKVGKEVREVLWKTVDPDVREACLIPKGCESVEPWQG